MKAIAIKIKTYTGGVNIIDNNDLRKRIFSFMLMGLGALALCYVFLLGSMVFNIIERKGLEADARVLSNEVGDLELNYLSLSNKIDLNLSHSLGFNETHAIFSTRQSLGSLKIANNEL
jgi:hypothetical protein